jgi:hypothetical protein
MNRNIFKPKTKSSKFVHLFYLSIIFGGLLALLKYGNLIQSTEIVLEQTQDQNKETKVAEFEEIRDQYNKLRQSLRMKPIKNLQFVNQVEIQRKSHKSLISSQTPVKASLAFKGSYFLGRIIAHEGEQILLSPFDQNSALLVQLGDYQTLLFGQGKDMANTDKIPLSVKVNIGDTVKLASSPLTPAGFDVGTVVDIKKIPNQNHMQIIVQPDTSKIHTQFAMAYNYESS